jgi:ribonuclease P protein component
LRLKSKTIRLTGANTFKRVFDGKRIATEDLVFYFRPNGADCGRVGLVVGRKAYAGAVTRNHLKRRLRELFRKKLGALRGFDVVIVAKRGRKEPGFELLERQMNRLALTVEGK